MQSLHLHPMSFQSIKELSELVKEGCSMVDDLKSNLTYGQDVANFYHYDLFDMIQTEFFSIDSVLKLLESFRFKDCFTITRTIFESFLVFWLMVRAKKYRQATWYTAEATEKKSAQQIRNEVFDRWSLEREKGNPKYKHIIHMKKLKEKDQFYVLYEFEGRFEEKNKMHIPNLYFLIKEEYDPAAKLEVLDSIKEGVIHHDPKRMKIHRDYYRHNLRFEALIENLLINDLIKENQADYLRVHYNFLSRYVHPSKESINPHSQNLANQQSRGYSNELLEELILLYLSRLQRLFFHIIVERMKEDNLNAIVKPFNSFMQKLDLASSHLWFFDNNPTEYDIEVSDAQKRLKKQVEKTIPSNQVLYYENPLDRLSRYWMRKNI